MRKASVVLVAMPWHALSLPSLQLTLLQAVLERASIRTEVFTLPLTFMQHCCDETADLPESEQIGIADYAAVVRECDRVGLGDWIFAVPPFRDQQKPDEQYLAFVEKRGVPQATIQKALTFRRLVPSFLQRSCDEILASGASVVGFTSSFSQNVASLALAQILKQRNPSLAIVFGGANCDGPMGEAIHRAFPWVDVVVRGEAERIVPDLMRDLVTGGPVRPQPGLCYRQDGRSVAVPQTGGLDVTMDDIPTPSFDEYFERLAQTSFAAEIAPDIQLVYESARGCWWGAKSHCTFCGLNGTSMAFRSKSPARVLEELVALARRYQRLDIRMVDNILDLRYLRDVMPQLRDAGYDMNLFYETKANLKRDQVRVLREAGIRSIQPGIESLSTPILRLMRKGVTALQNVRLLKWCAEYGVHVEWNLIHGFPGEPPDEYRRMAEVVPSLAHLTPPGLSRLTVDRFSPYHQRPGEFGIEILGPWAWYKYVYCADDATLMDLAYSFEYRLLEGPDPETYIGSLRGQLDTWRTNQSTGYRALRYRRGPGFLVIQDRRPNLESADYSLDDVEARLYLACENGASASEALNQVRADTQSGIDLEDVHQFFDELMGLRLLFEEDGHYLALALPATLPDVV